ncbi:hypothetical protein GYMLUDRAFT_263910 [Collybiopsis luxurians FD-317 M1]|uniref:Uncharacterized protein n=1 Tax=Collybiopsis luxurians FD-317 M1 TaxID=944289 RepID=A0A0D0CLL4_9AGAR|nr:hypothetical protein GYMLUDRAFT_263910 [Collybiopsis luxurians FD-317 M1]
MEFQSLLNFSQELDVSLLDRVVLAFYTGAGPEQQAAQTALTQFQDHPEAWTRVPEILQKSSFPQTKKSLYQLDGNHYRRAKGKASKTILRCLLGPQASVALTMFLVSFFGKHLVLLEETDREALLNAHFYLIKISQVDEREVWKICFEYWLILLVGLYEEAVSRLPIGTSAAGDTAFSVPEVTLRKDVYAEVLTNLRLIAVGKMVNTGGIVQFMHKLHDFMSPWSSPQSSS